MKLEIAVKKGQNPIDPNKQAKRKSFDTDASINNEMEVIEEEEEEEEEVKIEDNKGKKRKLIEDSSNNIEKPAPSLNRSMQLLVLGLPTDVTKKIFKMAVHKVVRKATLELISEEHPMYSTLEVLVPNGRIMWIGVPSRKDAVKMTQSLDGITIGNLNLKFPKDDNVEIVKRKEKLVVRSLADVTEYELRKRKNRLIIRNLSFQATEQNVADKLSKFGPLIEVSIPKLVVKQEDRKQNEDGSRGFNRRGKSQDEEKLRPRGFAFVTFLCSKDAEEAVSASSSFKICNREVAVDFCLRRDIFEEHGQENEDGEKENDEDKDDEVENKEDKIMKEDKSDSSNSDEDDSDEDDSDVDDSDVDSDNKDDVDNDEDNDENDDDDEEEDEKDHDGDDNDKYEDEKKDADYDDVRLGCTVFVRDLAFDVESKDLYKAFTKFGKIIMAIVVKDKGTGIGKGSAFIKFDKPHSAEACVSAASSGADTSSSGSSYIEVKERRCRVDMAVDREKAKKLKQEDKEGLDKRNLYLANEGLLVESGEKDVKMDMPPEDKEKRIRAQQEKKKKLVNPLFFVSANRISIRNLSKTITDGTLKILCLKALKSAISKKLVTKKDVEVQLIAQGVKPVDRTPERLSLPGITKGTIKSSKVMLDLNRMRNGLPQSRGYGFVEFREHVHALAVLRELNNNKAYREEASNVGQGSSRLILEFSLENIRKVMILNERESKRASERESSSTDVKNIKRKLDNEDNDDDYEDGDDDNNINEDDSSIKIVKRMPKGGRNGAPSERTYDAEGRRTDLTPQAKKRKLDMRRREKEAKRIDKKLQKIKDEEEGKVTDQKSGGYGGHKRIRAGKGK
jgi:nucleolar protein 4